MLYGTFGSIRQVPDLSMATAPRLAASGARSFDNVPVAAKKTKSAPSNASARVVFGLVFTGKQIVKRGRRLQWTIQFPAKRFSRFFRWCRSAGLGFFHSELLRFSTLITDRN